jgi:hypothetical protein
MIQNFEVTLSAGIWEHYPNWVTVLCSTCVSAGLVTALKSTALDCRAIRELMNGDLNSEQVKLLVHWIRASSSERSLDRPLPCRIPAPT